MGRPTKTAAALESDLGHRLFVRKTRALALTDAGERLARSARQALSALDRSVDDDLPGDAAGSWSHWLDHAGVSANADANTPMMVVTFVDQSMQAAVRGQGVVLARNPFRDDMVAGGQLVLPFPALRAPTGFGMYLVVSRNTQGRKDVGQLRNWLLEEFGRAPARRS
jgi:DNA-binding transcriptional LysR family regulator